ncbi:MAG TPA: hypothetical protein VLV89_02395 [Candidatus Acidoferrum sp.]|nr:hypothetical protein [Candidatus Acidoferrum sp.]
MRLKSILVLASITAVSAIAVCAVVAPPLNAGPPLRAQNPDTIPAEKSAAMAKEIVQQMIAGLGGDTYLTVRDSDCTGRISQFGPLTGELGGFAEFHSYWIYPDKFRREITRKGIIIDVYNGNQAWSLDRGGVTDLDPNVAATFQAGLKTAFDPLIRYRLKEPNLEYRYRGYDVVDLKQTDWVEITDSEERAFRIAVDRGTHLPVRFIVTTRDPKTGDPTSDTTIYSNWHPESGVEMPLQISREKDGKRVQQSFYYGCKINSGVLPELFTKQDLERRWKGKKSK